MLEIKIAVPHYTASIDIYKLPEDYHDAIRKFGLEYGYNCFDYSDGDYKVVPNWELLKEDLTPDEVMEQYLEDELDESTYPHPGWKEVFSCMYTYITWVRALRYIAANVPPGTLEAHTLAIYVWH